MSYMHIDNLYKNQDILLFKECYASEKIHGTSAHIGWNGKVFFFSGGESYDMFIALFDKEKIYQWFELTKVKTCTIYGEAYGGKCQGMRETYGDKLRFVAFEVKIGDNWLSVPDAEEFVSWYGFDFVPYVKVSTTLEELDFWCNAPSQQSVKNGIIEERKREGIVLRPLIEVRKNNGERIIVKHKNEEFAETKTKRSILDIGEKLEILTKARDIATEWVTPVRLIHILDNFPNAGIEQTGDIIKAMIEDVEREASGEIVISKESRKEISKQTALMFKQRLKDNFIEENR